jgi:glycolate oxidase iron-sulfur subunit
MQQLLPHVNRLRILAFFGSLYHAFGLSALAHKLLPFLPRFLQTAEGLLPEKPHRPPTRASSSTSCLKPRGRVGLFTGCIQEAFLGNVNQATVRVLERNGFEVVIPTGQTCCGALQIHMSEYGIATNLAKQNVCAFLDAGVETIVCNAGGCGAAMKGYPELLKNDPVFGKLALDFYSKLQDISEFLVEQKARPTRIQFSIKAAYADSCHLRNVQGVIDQPRFILNNIPGLELVELAHPERCCGSAGVYNLLHPDISDPLLDDKVKDIQASGVDVVLVANPGCQLQIQAGLRRNGVPVRALHFIELLDEAYRMEEENIC